MKKYLKHIIFNLAFLILNSFCFSQNVDSLKLALKNAKHDTTRCNVLSVLAAVASDEEGTKFNEQLLKLSESKIKLTQKSSSERKVYLVHYAAALNTIGVIYINKGDFQKGLDYNFKSLKIYEELGNKMGIAKSMLNIASIYHDQGDVSKALDYHFKSLKIKQELGGKKEIAKSLNNIAVIYDNQGDIPKALEYHSKSLKLREEIGDNNGIALSLNNIGFIYNNQGDASKALEYFKKSLKIQEKNGIKKGIAISLNNIGVIYKNRGEYSKAKEYLLKSLKIGEEIGDKIGVAASLKNIGIIYENQGDIRKAMEYYSKSLKIAEEVGHKRGVVGSLCSIGYLYYQQGNLKEGLTYTTRALNISRELGFPEAIKNSATTLKLIYQKQNKYKEAFEMYELELKMRDSINNQETQKAAIKKQMQYTYEKKELENKAEQDKKDTIAKAELKQKENERNYFIAGFGLVAILALFILRGYKQKQKANAIILHQKHLVDEKQKEILDSIYYARKIQLALLPSEKYIDKNLAQLNKKS